jgi:hypothetical protein
MSKLIIPEIGRPVGKDSSRAKLSELSSIKAATRRRHAALCEPVNADQGPVLWAVAAARQALSMSSEHAECTWSVMKESSKGL